MSNLNRELAEEKITKLRSESEALTLARSVRRSRAKTLRHNRRVLRNVAAQRVVVR